MKKASMLMILGSSLLLGLFVLPMWNIRLGAPQYPDPLGIDIYINGLKGENEFDIQNIDGLNHYIGMKTLPKPEDMWEFDVFPKVVGGMAALGIIIGILGLIIKISPFWFLTWFLAMSVLGVLGFYDFNLWLVDYGSDLDPNAIMKLVNPDGTPMVYNPPMIGHKKLLNFDAYSYPRSGGILMGIGLLMTLAAFYLGRKSKLAAKARGGNKASLASFTLLAFLFVSACSQEPDPISYGHDGCHFCRMTIVDKQHAAQIVTSKGRNYKYDAIECMVYDLNNWDRPAPSKILVADYAVPGELTKATDASFLITEKIPSPMGAFLTAFALESELNKTHQSAGGDKLSWEEVKMRLNKTALADH
ncbi:nitrous oxide reductase accessory protein NosL [Algoriphagus kandeliae]|uniref:nitrous oxide reductase accessory protein NosL n=1 Tax=Algoriphagus kandeliae TaxID=2562278 RepID=UPI00192A2603|nr:nitrous oxide reductase accessory protein NosL [Algoriphagus kandeliae]